MKNERKDRMKAAARKGIATEAREMIALMRDNFVPGPSSVEAFYQTLEERCKNPIGHGETGEARHIIGTTCIQVPDEVVIALGIRAIRLCSGSHTYDQAGSEYMPARACSLVRSTQGFLQTEELQNELDMVVIPATCDQKKKSAEMLEASGYNTHVIDLPSRKDTDHARAYWQDSVADLIVRLEETCGRRLTASKVRAAAGAVGRAREQFRRLHNLRRHTPPVIHGKDVFMVTGAYSSDHIEQWTESLSALNQELERRIAEGKHVAAANAPRLLFTGSPPIFPNLKVPVLAESLGGVIVADEVCSSSRLLYDAVAFEEPRLYDMLPAIADRYLKPCTCPCLVPNQERRDRIFELVRSFQVDGVIYQAFSGCQLYEIEHRLLGDALTKEGISMLYVETDYSHEDIGQLSTRMEAFLESIRIRKRNQGRTERTP